MNITECSNQLQVLAKAHANYTMSLEDYLRDRKILLDTLDLNINGITVEQPSSAPMPIVDTVAEVQQAEAPEQQDKTQPYFAKKIDKCISFIKGSSD